MNRCPRTSSGARGSVTRSSDVWALIIKAPEKRDTCIPGSVTRSSQRILFGHNKLPHYTNDRKNGHKNYIKMSHAFLCQRRASEEARERGGIIKPLMGGGAVNMEAPALTRTPAAHEGISPSFPDPNPAPKNVTSSRRRSRGEARSTLTVSPRAEWAIALREDLARASYPSA